LIRRVRRSLSPAKGRRSAAAALASSVRMVRRRLAEPPEEPCLPKNHREAAETVLVQVPGSVPPLPHWGGRTARAS
jgi:hypothetical protein